MPRKRPLGRRTPATPTILLLTLLVAGVYFVANGPFVPSRIKVSNFEIDTASVGLAILFLDVVVLIVLVAIGQKLGQSLVLYDPWKHGDQPNSQAISRG